MKSFFHIVCILLTMSVWSPVSAQLTMFIDTVSGNSGDQVVVPVRANGFTSLISMQGTIIFDPAVVSYVGVEQFNLAGLGSGNFGTTNVGTGQLTFSWFDGDLSGESLTDSSVVFAIRFDLVGDAGDSSIINFDSVPTALEFVDAGFSVVGATFLDGEARINGTPSGSGLTLLIDSVTANIYDTVVIPVRATNFQYIVGIQGTIGFDETVASYITIEQFGLPGMTISNFGETQTSSGLLTFSWNSLNTGGESVTDSSILFAIKYVAIGAGGTNTDISFLGSPTPMEVIDSNLFIVNPYLQGGYLEINPDTNQVFTLLIDSVNGMETQKVQVPIRSQSFSDIISVQGTFEFDTAVINYSSVVNMNLQGMTLGDFGTSFVNDGLLTFSWFDGDLSGETYADSTILFELEFDIVGIEGDFGYVKLVSSPTSIEVINTALQTIPYGLDSGGVAVDSLSAFIDGGLITQNSYCAGDSIFVPYGANTTFDPANVFTIQLSDATGNFGSPINIGTVISPLDTDTIGGLIPDTIVYGTGYRVRVQASNPGLMGTDNGNDLTVMRYLDTVTTSICAGDSILLGGQFQMLAGYYIDTLTSIDGCDSVNVTDLSVLGTSYINDTIAICNGDSILLEGIYQYSAGSYSDTLVSFIGCDSIVYTELIINPVFSTNSSTSICPGDSILLEGVYQNSAGVYRDTLPAVNGCDSIIVTTLSIFAIDSILDTLSICQGDSAFLGGAYQFVAGIYVDVFTDTNGCDSTLITTLNILPLATGNDSLAICSGDSALLGGTYQTLSGTYIDIYTAINGCDSTVTTILNVLSTYDLADTVVICQGDSVFIAGAWRETAAQYPDSFIALNGCDSVIITDLIVLSTSFGNDTVAICNGDSILIGGAYRSIAGSYDDTLVSFVGCDSIVSVELTIDPVFTTNLNAIICPSDSMLLEGAYQNLAGVYSDTLVAVTGCDSIILTTLSIFTTDTTLDTVSICQGDSILLGGSYQFIAGNYIDLFADTNGCDSTLISTLLILPQATGNDSVAICMGDSALLGGSYQTLAGNYTDVYTAVNGCDSTVTTILNVLPTYDLADTVVICQGDSAFIAGGWRGIAALYPDSFIAMNGCDSVWVTNLIVNPTYLDTPIVQICIGDSMFLDGTWRDTSGTFTDSLVSINGCDSVVVTILIVDSVLINNMNAIICDGDSILLQGDFQTLAGVYIDSLIAVAGCDSLVFTTLAIDTGNVVTDSISICLGDSILLGGNWQDTTGLYVDTLVNINGCDSVVGTILNVIVPILFSDTVNICLGDSLFLEGAWQLSAGTYIDSGIAATGCDSVTWTTLILNPSVPGITASDTTTFCMGDSVVLTSSSVGGNTWSPGGDTTQSIVAKTTGTYTVMVTDSNLCTAVSSAEVVTVHALPTVSITGTDTICEGDTTTLSAGGGNAYLWNTGDTIDSISVSPTVTTIYTAIVTDTNVCSDSSTMVIKVNPLPIPVITSSGPTTICPWDSITLTSTSGLSYLWSPGGDTTQSINVDTSGIFIVTLTDTNLCVATSSADTIIVNQPNALLSGVTTICEGDSTLLTASGGVSYLWTTGDTTNVINVSPNLTMSYSVAVTDNGGCNDTSTIIVTVNALPASSITGTDTICEGDTTVLTALGGAFYLWNTGDTIDSITIGPVTSTSYTVNVTDTNGCSDSSTVVVQVNPLPISGITSSGSTTFCTGDSITLTSTSGFSYLWSPGGDTTQSINVDSSGIYAVTLTDSNLCIVVSPADTVSVSQPTAAISGTTTICEEDSITLTASGGISYSWNIGDTTSVITIAPNLSAFYSVNVTDGGGCTDSATVNVIVNPKPTVSFTGNTSVCDGLTTSITANGGVSYLWSTSESTNTITVGPLVATYFSVLVTDSNTCENMDSILVSVNANPTAVIVGDTTVCEGQSLNLLATGGTGFSWSTGDTTNGITVSPVGTTPYSVVVTDANGCSGSEVITISVDPLPSALFVFSSNGATVNLNSLSQNATTLQWLFGDGGSDFISNPQHTYAANGTYTVTLIAFNACGTDTATQDISVTVVGIEEYIQDVELLVFPNPNSGKFMIIISDENNLTKGLRIIDLMGRVVLEKMNVVQTHNSEISINIEHVNPGLYEVQVIGDGGVLRKTIVVE